MLPQDIEKTSDVLILQFQLAIPFMQLCPQRREQVLGSQAGPSRVARRHGSIALLQGPQSQLRLLQVGIPPLQGALGHLQGGLLAIQLVLQAEHLLLRSLLPASLVCDLGLKLLSARTLGSNLPLQLQDAAVGMVSLSLSQQSDGPQRLCLSRLVGCIPHARQKSSRAEYCRRRGRAERTIEVGHRAVQHDYRVRLRADVHGRARTRRALAVCCLCDLEASLALAPRLSQQAISQSDNRGVVAIGDRGHIVVGADGRSGLAPIRALVRQPPVE
mmetsp:Transcript_163696/g.524978  ORF Transcript_163696/g.524978 Transcript_163696/m.524978 type:complete len:273 (+) Transcript_163696:125-943(+)